MTKSLFCRTWFVVLDLYRYNSILFFPFPLFFVQYEVRIWKQHFQMDINCEIGFLNIAVSCEPFIFVLLAIYFPILLRRFHYCYCFLLTYISNGSINENPNNIPNPYIDHQQSTDVAKYIFSVETIDWVKFVLKTNYS